MERSSPVQSGRLGNRLDGNRTPRSGLYGERAAFGEYPHPDEYARPAEAAADGTSLVAGSGAHGGGIGAAGSGRGLEEEKRP